MQRLTYTFYVWRMAVMASRHWTEVPESTCRVFKDPTADYFQPPWILEVTVNGATD